MDVQVLDLQSSEAARLFRLQAEVDGLLDLDVLEVRLFKGDGPISKDTGLGDLGGEANFAGYAPIPVTEFIGPAIDPEGNAYAATPVLDFACAGGGVSNTIRSAALCTPNGGATATADITHDGGAIDSITVTDGGSGYEVAPKVTIGTTGTGSGATAHAVVNAGVVTEIVIDTPGTLYDTPTITIDPPVSLFKAQALEAAVPMGEATDHCMIVMQLQDPDEPQS